MAEKRLISYDVLMKHLDSCIKEGKGLVKYICVAIKCFVEQMPAVDAVEVVRCKDCKFGVIPYGDEHDGWIECSNIHGRPLFTCDGFCSYGERRTDGQMESVGV